MKIKTYSQLQAVRARIKEMMPKKFGVDGDMEGFNRIKNEVSQVVNGKKSAFIGELKALAQALIDVEDAGIEPILKSAHEEIKLKSGQALKAKENPIMTVKTKLENFLRQKSVVIDSADGSELAIAEMISDSIVARTRQSSGLLSQMTVAPLASVKPFIRRELTDAQIARYAETDGVIGFSNPDTVSGSIMKNYLTLSKLYHKLPITDEAMHDVPDLVAFTLEQLQEQYNEQFGLELVLGESASEELPGVFTDLLDADNAYVESFKADGVRDANTFGAVVTGAADGLGERPLDVFNALVGSLPAKLLDGAVVTMNPETLRIYKGFTDSSDRPLFDITPKTFQGYPLSLDDNFPMLGDASKAVVSFGVADTALEMGNIDLKLQENPFQRDGVVLFKHIGRVGVACADNLALRVLLAQA
jgi:HK97 family phage major capsid protein